MKLSLDWVAESEQNEDGNLSSHIDNYTNTDVYEYIVELDAEGKLSEANGSEAHEPTIRTPRAAIEKENTEVAVPRVPLLDESASITAGEFETDWNILQR